MNNNKRNKHGRANQIKVETRDLTGQNDTHRPEGIYYPTVTVTDDKGNIYTDSIAVTVLNREKMDALLKGKWEGMKRALVDQDVEGALGYFDKKSKEKYRRILQILKDNLSSIAAGMEEIKMVDIKQYVAKYRISRTEDIEGQTKEITYLIYLVKNENGEWKIEGL